VKGAPPGKYLLTAETKDFDAGTRIMGFYPGVSRHADATSIEVKAVRAGVKEQQFCRFDEQQPHGRGRGKKLYRSFYMR
jgi:hypothetical protein